MKARLLIICLLSLTTACGFHLRGSQLTAFDVANIYLQSAAAPKLERELKSQLSGAGVGLAESSANASYSVAVKEERFERNVLSVAADTGKVEEYQIVYTAKLDAYRADGSRIVEDDGIRTSRDFTFDEDAVLGKFSEETLIQEDLVRGAASQVLRRLQALLKDK